MVPISNERTRAKSDRSIEGVARPIILPKKNGSVGVHVKIPPQLDQSSEQALYKELQFNHFSDDEQGATTVILYADGRIMERQRRDYKQ